MIVPRSDSGQLQIRWNGLGAPVVAHTMNLLRQGMQPRLRIGADGVASVNGLGSFAFGLACRGKGTVALEESQTPNKDNVVGFDESATAMIKYPKFVIDRRPQPAHRGA